MHRAARLFVGTITVVALAACGSGAATGAPGAGAGAACAKSSAAGTVKAGVADFAFAPSTVTAKVGDVITWTNGGPASHTVTVDNAPACDTGAIASGSTGSLTFSAAGSYPFHCSIHSSMKGTITISG
ncbi:MAG TPA: plastocyanin/azurin family copper-binding protein [Candidatus Limnocylindrales bacterium]|nr:plastocyanin/azurin family copper-binding protein [Candidatus Limnocylindrales bacterium]